MSVPESGSPTSMPPAGDPPAGETLDAILHELAKRLRADTREEAPGRFRLFLKHPATLVVLTFALTSGVGGCLASRWQRAGWEQQQRRLNSQREIELKYTIVGDLTNAVAETTTAAEEVLVLTHWDLPNVRAETAERRKFWSTSSRNWRVASKRLQTTVASHFSPAVAKAFDEIVVGRKAWGNEIANVLATSSSVAPKSSDSSGTLGEVNTTISQLRKLTSEMIDEIHADEARTLTETDVRKGIVGIF